jgi:hypothetical protein
MFRNHLPDAYSFRQMHREHMTPTFQKIVERIAEAILELGSDLLADQTIDEQVRGLHALHLSKILTTARSHAPPDAKEGFKFKPRPDLMDRPVILVVQAKSPKTKLDKTKPVPPAKAKQWGRECIYTAAMIDEALDKSGGLVAPAALAHNCSPVVIYKHCKTVGRKPVDPRDRARPAGIIWNAANRAKLLDIASGVPRPSVEEMGPEIGITAVAIQTGMSRAGITKINGRTPTQLTRRPCLNCRTPFLSTHKGNRRFPKCIAADSKIAA